MYESGFSVTHIAQELDSYYQVVYERLKNYYGTPSLTSNKGNNYSKRNDYWQNEAKEFIENSKLIKRVTELYPPIGDEIPENVIDEIIKRWNNKDKGVINSKNNLYEYPNKTTLKDLAREFKITIDQLKRIIINDHRVIKGIQRNN